MAVTLRSGCGRFLDGCHVRVVVTTLVAIRSERRRIPWLGSPWISWSASRRVIGSATAAQPHVRTAGSSGDRLASAVHGGS